MILDNQYFVAIASILILLYSSQIRPNLSPKVRRIFNNPIFRILFLFLLLNGKLSPMLSISLAIMFYLIIIMLKEQEINENFGIII